MGHEFLSRLPWVVIMFAVVRVSDFAESIREMAIEVPIAVKGPFLFLDVRYLPLPTGLICECLAFLPAAG